MAEQIGYRVVGTIKSIKGACSAGHKVGTPSSLAATVAPGYAASSTITSSPTSSCFSSAAASHQSGETLMSWNWTAWTNSIWLP